MFGDLPIRGLALLFGPALLIGCAADPSEDTGDEDAERRPMHGWVVVERDEVDGSVRTSVSAKFLQLTPALGERTSGLLADAELAAAEELVGVRTRVPSSGDCVPLRTLEPSPMQVPRLSIDLVDVGDVTLSMQGSTKLSLAPRAFPDIGDIVSGVFYTSPDAAARLLAPADYEIEATGAGAIDAFTIDVRAPEAPRKVVVAGRPLDDGSTATPIDAGSDIELAWAAPAPGESSLIYVDLRADAGEGGAQGHRCTFPDGGAAVLPVGMFPAGATNATLTLHRLAERAVTMRGAEERHPAIVVFDLATTVRLELR
ncbi:MAG: hypothetical protein IPM79_32710 [Polyangiaceae bacterium]|jgi:hypothetical protein|nr:hypothetical protein [Polyangiaceae bacterium]